jgi:outer membrane protein TolC
MIIRQEQPADYDEVYELVKKSFATSTNEGEWDYLNEVRKKDTFIPELSLVAENDDGKLIGQIVLYKTNITASDGVYTELLLSPISVHPDFFRRGIARAMMKEAFQIAKNKYDAGLIREVEELQMEVDLGAAQNDFDIAVVNYESMLNNFKQQIGISLQDSVILKRDTAYNIVAIDGEKAIQLGLENRLEIREKEIRIELSNLDIKKNKSNGMIKGEISAYYDFTGISNSDRTLSFRNAFDNSWTDLQNRPTNRGIYFSIYVPLLDWGVNRSLVKAAKAYKIKNENALEFQKISIENEIRNLVKQTLSSLKRLQLLEKNVTVAERNFEISKSRFRNGDIDGQALALDRARLNGAYISKLEAFISYKLLLADLARKTFYDFEKNKSLLE